MNEKWWLWIWKHIHSNQTRPTTRHDILQANNEKQKQQIRTAHQKSDSKDPGKCSLVKTVTGSPQTFHCCHQNLGVHNMTAWTSLSLNGYASGGNLTVWVFFSLSLWLTMCPWEINKHCLWSYRSRSLLLTVSFCNPIVTIFCSENLQQKALL